MNPDSGDILDAAQVEDLRGIDDGAMFAKLVRMYLVKAPERIQLLRGHVAAANFAGMAQEAHALKGASGSIGAIRVADACRQIEQAVKAQDAGPVEALTLALDEEFGRARDALQAIAGPG